MDKQWISNLARSKTLWIALVIIAMAAALFFELDLKIANALYPTQ